MPGHCLGSAVRLSPTVEKQKLKLELLRGSKPKLESLPVSVVVHEHLVRGLYVLWNYYAANSHAATPEQLRLPMFIVGSMRASGSEFDVFVVDAGGQLPVSDALFFVAGDWLPAACRSLLPLMHQEGIASSPSTRPRDQVVSSLSSLAKEITTRVRKVACACKIESRICSLSTLLKFVLE